jgi:KDO2-lipid IV(A) lauroyltransferase
MAGEDALTPGLSSGGSRAGYLTFRALGEVLKRLPEPIAAAAGYAAGMLMWAMPSKRRSIHARHMARVLGRELPEVEAREWARRAFVSYARYWVEGARLPALQGSVVEDRMVIESGMENLVEGMRLGRGVVMVLPHVGSWEWGGAWLALRGFPMTSVAEPLEPPELYEYFVEQRKAIGLDIVKLGEASRYLLTKLGEGGLVGLLCDRDLVGNGVEVDFFGEKTKLPAGPALLALHTGAVLLPTAVYSGPGRDHTGLIEAPVAAERKGHLRDDVSRVTQDLAIALERLIRRAPEQWHLFQPNWPSDPRS